MKIRTSVIHRSAVLLFIIYSSGFASGTADSSVSHRDAWGTVGVGGGKGAAVMLFGYSSYSGASVLSGRLMTSFTPPLLGASRSLPYTEVAGLCGWATRSRFLTASVSAGVSYATGNDNGAFSTIGLPLELHAALTPFASFGIAGKLFWNANPKKPWGGLTVGVYLGI